MIYIVDIDQTICLTPIVDKKHRYDMAIPFNHRIEEINKLYDQGHTIIYWTARGASTGIDWTDYTTQQINEWGCKFTELRLGKPNYDCWIDDKAFNDKEFFRHKDRKFIEDTLINE